MAKIVIDFRGIIRDREGMLKKAENSHAKSYIVAL